MWHASGLADQIIFQRSDRLLDRETDFSLKKRYLGLNDERKPSIFHFP